MSKTIWKYPLTMSSKQIVELPACSTILSVQLQENVLQLWALVEPNYKHYLEKRHITIYATGEEMPDNCGTYLTTFQVLSLVFHVFEEGETE